MGFYLDSSREGRQIKMLIGSHLSIAARNEWNQFQPEARVRRKNVDRQSINRLAFSVKTLSKEKREFVTVVNVQERGIL